MMKPAGRPRRLPAHYPKPKSIKTNAARYLVTAATWMLSSCVLSAPFNLYLDEFEGGKIKAHHQQTFIEYMANNNCQLTITDKANHAQIMLAMDNTKPKTFNPWLTASTYQDTPLSLSVVVKSSRGLDNLAQLTGERIAIVHSLAQMGFLNEIGDLNAQGLDLNSSDVFESGRYDGALALLLHGDVFAAVLPTPLAMQWQTKNKLSLLANSATQQRPYLAIHESITLARADAKQCEQAFLTLNENSKKAGLLSVFPLWVEGFEIR